ncbi:GNAT family N-acetyltransferase [Hydrogenophaga sp. OTU3427]|uniref:GNAT family N-acetyltransferase n=1 Tax=Hydrogenophaga sp. OTU3427 TaxID=3043856 RepID=UPI00313CF387
MHTLLDNVFWHALSGPQAHCAVGSATARRFAPGFSPIVGFADPAQPDFAALAPHCQPGDRFYCDGWTGAAPAGWQIEVASTMYKMVWDGPLPPADEGLDAKLLDASHVAEAMELATLTRPGPFGPRTLELGRYVGCFEGGQLIAMAGERTQAGRYREVSGICTHPDHQGRGLARRLTARVVRHMLLQGETPFLHVMRDNVGAHALYQRMGFRDHRESVIRVVVFGG